ncbi:MAG: phosphatidate cytidylyltransferase [Spirochaetales bacterium]|nr:phosphatidate cytidylyltransferase [Spirochaetales bacterium]
MTNTIKRLILFSIAIPSLSALILLLPQQGHLAVILLLVVVGALCGLELRSMLARVARPIPHIIALLPALSPLVAWAVGMGWMPSGIATALFVFLVLWALSDAAFVPSGEITSGVMRVGTRLLMVMYPTWCLWWTAKITWFPQAGLHLMVFMLCVFLNDSAAWLFGVLFGKHRGFVAVSPNKSLEGFAGGIFASVVVMCGAAFILPQLYSAPLWQSILYGIALGVASILGDLTESALKRSVGVKDSGNVILGRGGMLDSVDSILLAAPIFVLYLQAAIVS